MHPLMSECSWAANRSKLERAIRKVRGDNEETGEVGSNEVVEQAVVEEYRKLLGRVIEEHLPKAPKAKKSSKKAK